MKKIYVLSLLAMLFSFTSCWDNDYQEDFEEIRAKATGVDGDSGECPVGKWAMPTCNGAPGKNLIYYFGSNGTGYSANPECSNMCSGPLKFNFTYKVVGDEIRYRFTGADPVTCNGSTSTPTINTTKEYVMTYTCLNGGSQLQTEYVDVQTGARSTYNFTRM